MAKRSSAQGVFTEKLAEQLQSIVEDLNMKHMSMFLGDYHVTQMRYEGEMLVVSLANGQWNKRELWLKPVIFREEAP